MLSCSNAMLVVDVMYSRSMQAHGRNLSRRGNMRHPACCIQARCNCSTQGTRHVRDGLLLWLFVSGLLKVDGVSLCCQLAAGPSFAQEWAVGKCW